MRRGPSWHRAAVLWLLLLALLGGTVELHTDAADHAAGLASGDGPLFVCAEGHVPGSHVERPRTAEHHDCAACLHRLNVRGGGFTAATTPGSAGGGDSVPAARPAAVTAPPLSRAPSRGPPAV